MTLSQWVEYFTIYSVLIYWDVLKYSLSSSISSKRVNKCYTILHANPPQYEDCVTPFPCSLLRPTHTKLCCNVSNGWRRVDEWGGEWIMEKYFNQTLPCTSCKQIKILLSFVSLVIHYLCPWILRNIWHITCIPRPVLSLGGKLLLSAGSSLFDGWQLCEKRTFYDCYLLKQKERPDLMTSFVQISQI